MLVLARKKHEIIFILDKDCRLVMIITGEPHHNNGGLVKIGIKANTEWKIVRDEHTTVHAMSFHEKSNIPIGTPIGLIPRAVRDNGREYRPAVTDCAPL